MTKRVIAEVRTNGTNELFGNVVSMSGGVLHVELGGDESNTKIVIPIVELKEKYGVHVDWKGATPVGAYLGEF